VRTPGGPGAWSRHSLDPQAWRGPPGSRTNSATSTTSAKRPAGLRADRHARCPQEGGAGYGRSSNRGARRRGGEAARLLRRCVRLTDDGRPLEASGGSYTAGWGSLRPDRAAKGGSRAGGLEILAGG
jgi:hypothetical protein